MKWISTILLICIIPLQSLINSPAYKYSISINKKADSLYAQKSYKSALSKYIELSKNETISKNNPILDFKLAFCYYQNKQYFQAQNILNANKLFDTFLPEYTGFLKFKTAININHNAEFVEKKATDFLEKFNYHFLADSVLIYLAGYLFENREYKKSKLYYSKLTNHKYRYKKSPFIRKQIALIEYELGNKKIALARMTQLLKKYPSSKDALDIVRFLEERRLDDNDLFFNFVDVYLKNGYTKYLHNKLKAFISATDDDLAKERAQYYLYRVNFLKGHYKVALAGFKWLYKNVKEVKLKPRILIYIARSYLRLGEKNRSAQTYIEYSKEFPRRRLAPECAWKAAWIYEELNNLEKALELYRAVQKHWHKNNFKYEARFREALTLYRMGFYSSAALILKDIVNSRWSNIHKNRANYWLSLTYNKLDQHAEAKNILNELSKNTFDDFYTMKAFLDQESNIDKIKNENSEIIDNPLNKYKSSTKYTNTYSNIFLIDELMGREYVFKELSLKKYRPKDLPGWVVRAELFKKLGYYNKAFKIYDMINYTYFAGIDILDKPFILKEKYPFYFEKEVEQHSLGKDLDKHFILAIVREESGFDKNALSWANAYGLMQIIPRTASELASELNLEYSSPEDLFEIDLNLRLGIHYVSKLSKMYDNKKEYILAAYNAGPHRVSRWKNYINNNTADFLVENIEFSQTRNYVKKVLKNYWAYSILDKIY